MDSIQHMISELSTKAIVSGKFTAAQIVEVTKQGSQEQQLSKLKELTESADITIPSRDTHYAAKVLKLTEQLAASGKLQGFQIVEALQNCSTEEDRFQALTSLAIAKKIGVTPIVRKNGSEVIAEAVRRDDKTRVQEAMTTHKCSFREASIICDLPDPGRDAKAPEGFNEALAQEWRDYAGGLISESDITKLVAKGVRP